MTVIPASFLPHYAAFNAVPWDGDSFIATPRTTAWTCQSAAITKDEATVLALGGLHSEAG